MHKFGKFLGFLALFLALPLAMGNVALGAGKTLTLSVPSEVTGLDPQKANSLDAMNIAVHIFEGLVRVHDGKVLPGMAESWEISEDGTTYIFHLRDALWSDGVPVTAKDFEYGMIRLLDPATASEYAFAGNLIENGDEFTAGTIKDPAKVGVKALDDKTLEIRLKQPADYFLGYLYQCNFYPVRQEIVEKYGERFATEAKYMVYNGPFVLKTWKHEQELVLVKNPKYWNADAIKLDKVNILQIYESNTALSMFETGELDMVDIPFNMYEEYLQEGKAEVYFSGANDWFKVNVRPNPEKPWLANKNFRKALAYAIDRENYLKIATKGLYVPNQRILLPLIAGVNERYFVEEFPLEYYSVKAEVPKAKEYLAKAMEELGIQDPSEISITYLIQDEEVCRVMSETLQSQISSNLGINFDVRMVTRKQRMHSEQKGDYDVVYHGWAPDYDDPMTYLEIWQGNSSQNNSGYANPEVDLLIDQARGETDKVKRAEMLFQAEQMLLDDAAVIPLQLRRNAWSLNPGITGILRPFVGGSLNFVYADVEN